MGQMSFGPTKFLCENGGNFIPLMDRHSLTAIHRESHCTSFFYNALTSGRIKNFCFVGALGGDKCRLGLPRFLSGCQNSPLSGWRMLTVQRVYFASLGGHVSRCRRQNFVQRLVCSECPCTVHQTDGLGHCLPEWGQGNVRTRIYPCGFEIGVTFCLRPCPVLFGAVTCPPAKNCHRAQRR